MFFISRSPKLTKRNYDYISRCVHYVQGQSPKPHIREYFYYIDHQGQLFLDDSRIKNFTSCFKEKKFLEFFFKRLKTYDSGRYSRDFPYVSLCGRELNYIRVDDLPIVFTHILETTDGERMTYAHAGDLLTVPFQPQGLCMLPENGRVYHPAPSLPTGVGLVKSSLAIELSQTFEFREGGDEGMPTHFVWKGKRWELNNEVIELLRMEEERKQRLAVQTPSEDDVS